MVKNSLAYGKKVKLFFILNNIPRKVTDILLLCLPEIPVQMLFHIPATHTKVCLGFIQRVNVEIL